MNRLTGVMPSPEGLGSVRADDGTHYGIDVIGQTVVFGGRIELTPLAARALARLLELAAETIDRKQRGPL